MISPLSNGMPLITTETESPIRPTMFPVCPNMFFGVCAKSSPTSPKPPSYPTEKPLVDQQAFEIASGHPEFYESERSSFQPLHPASRNRRRVGYITALVALVLLALAIGTVASVVAAEVRNRALSHSRYVIGSQPMFCHDTYPIVALPALRNCKTVCLKSSRMPLCLCLPLAPTLSVWVVSWP